MNKGTFVLPLIFLIETSFAVQVTLLDKCQASYAEEPGYAVLGSERNTLEGWSHITTETVKGEYRELVLVSTDYATSKDHYAPDPDCERDAVQNAVLVVKLSDWTRQHSNGFEAIVDSQHDIAFGDVSHIMMDIRVNSQNTHILSVSDLRDVYGSYLTPTQLSELDHGKATLAISLFEEGAIDQTTESFNLEYLFKIDQNEYADKWVRVVISLEEFRAYTEKNHQSFVQKLDEFQKNRVKGFRLTAETSNGKQLRNLLKDKWSSKIPERFKEISLSIRQIKFLYLR